MKYLIRERTPCTVEFWNEKTGFVGEVSFTDYPIIVDSECIIKEGDDWGFTNSFHRRSIPFDFNKDTLKNTIFFWIPQIFYIQL